MLEICEKPTSHFPKCRFMQLVQNLNTFTVLTQENVCKTQNKEKELEAENLYHLII